MGRTEILNEVRQTLGAVPGWLDGMPDAVLEQQWQALKWELGDTKLSARDKALIAFGAATSSGCRY
ncbi:MAG: hypothetical protein HY716_13235 [Planctomycetes bacterium]|nr:hypothetical protein [Planctomycetota bacterium]